MHPLRAVVVTAAALLIGLAGSTMAVADGQPQSAAPGPGIVMVPVMGVQGGFEIRNVHSGKCLEVSDSDTFDGAKIQQWTCLGQQGSIWYAQLVQGSGFRIRNFYSNKCIVIQGGSNSNGAKAVLWNCFTVNSAVWAMWVGAFTEYHNVTNGRCLEISDSGEGNGEVAQQWDCVGQPGMYWR